MMVRSAFIKSAYNVICNNYGVNPVETWLYGNWFYTTSYTIFTSELKATNRSPPDDFGRWIISRSKGLTRKGIEKIGRSVRAYAYLVLTSQVQARSNIVGTSSLAVDAQKFFKRTFKALIDEDYSISNNIERYQDMLNIKVNKGKLPEPVKAKHDAPMKKKTVKEDHLMDKSRMLTEQHNDEKLPITLLIVGAGLIAYHFR